MSLLRHLRRLSWRVQHYADRSITGTARGKDEACCEHECDNDRHRKSWVSAADARRSAVAQDRTTSASCNGATRPLARISFNVRQSSSGTHVVPYEPSASLLLGHRNAHPQNKSSLRHP